MAMHRATHGKHLDVVRELLGVTGERALPKEKIMHTYKLACISNDEELREVLLDAGAAALKDKMQVDAAFYSACREGDLDVLREKLSQQGDEAIERYELRKALMDPAALQRPEVVRELLKAPVAGELHHTDVEHALAKAVDEQCPDEVLQELLVVTGDRAVTARALTKAFEDACAAGHAAAVRELLSVEGGRALSREKITAQMRNACKHGRVDTVRELLALTGDRAVRPMAVKNAHSAAVERGDTAIAELLASDGKAALEQVKAIEAAFVAACREGRSDDLRELLAAEGDEAIADETLEAMLHDGDALEHVGTLHQVMALGVGRAEFGDSRAFDEPLKLLDRAVTLSSPALLQAVLANCDDIDRAYAPQRVGYSFNDACGAGSLGSAVYAVLTDDSLRVADMDIEIDSGRGFVAACKGGHLSVVRDLISWEGKHAVDVSQKGVMGLLWAIKGNHMDIVRELLGLSGDRAIDIHARDEGAFRQACKEGQLDILRELLALTGDRAVDVHAKDEGGFELACEHGHIEVVRELLSLTEDRAVPAAAVEAARAAATEGGREAVAEVLAAHSQ